MTNEKEVKILVPYYSKANEKYQYMENYLKDGYILVNVYNYDPDYDVLVLSKDYKTVLIPANLTAKQVNERLASYYEQGYELITSYDKDLDWDAYILYK